MSNQLFAWKFAHLSTDPADDSLDQASLFAARGAGGEQTEYEAVPVFGADISGASIAGAVPATTAATTTTTTTTASAVHTVAATAAPASWIAGLSDSVIRTDMTAASAGGTVTEFGMAKLFTDLASELNATKTTLSAAQLSDLKAIAADLNVGESASGYVTYITGALIDGNAANTTWTGGAATSSALGNLAAGKTAAQLNELDGKWFLGTDLPSSTVQESNGSKFGITYSTVSNPVFAAAGPSINDINQGQLGDCYLLASLAETAKQDPAAISSMITNNGNGTYGVRFYVDGAPEYVTVNAALADGGNKFNRATDIWASLVEKAYTQLQASGVVTGNSVNDGNSYGTIGQGGFPEAALAEITGAPLVVDFGANGSSWVQVIYTSAGTLTFKQTLKKPFTVRHRYDSLSLTERTALDAAQFRRV